MVVFVPETVPIISSVSMLSKSKPSILNSEINLKEVGEARSKIPSIFHD